jgi:(p)ppGpp synthase/HD superfamily hydrolase
MTPSILVKAMNVSMEAHSGQVRKYTGEPYWNHCRAVAEQVAAWEGTLAMQCAAYLHDTLEDTDMSELRLKALFGYEVLNLVVELTDQYTPAMYPGHNRAARKLMEAARLGTCSLEARVIKLADIADNTKSIVAHDPGFATTYLAEKARLLSVIGDSRNQWRDAHGRAEV